ncbi:MAG: hypothetical protein ACJAZN_002060 [Planctomycetota bacterium]|jgi:hypothetical protein
MRDTLLGAVLGALLGVLAYRHFRRRPAAFYDLVLAGDQVLVGVDLLSKEDDEHRAKARAALEGHQFSVTELRE